MVDRRVPRRAGPLRENTVRCPASLFVENSDGRPESSAIRGETTFTSRPVEKIET